MDDKRRESLLAKVIELARENVDDGGRPFACLVANAAGEELAQKTDLVQQTGDPTGQGRNSIGLNFRLKMGPKRILKRTYLPTGSHKTLGNRFWENGTKY